MAEQPNYTFDDCQPGSRESYNVRSCRLGFYSDPSNEIYVSLPSGIDAAGAEADIPMGWRLTGDGIALTLPSGAEVRAVRVHDLSGRLILTIEEATDGTLLPLPPGAYIIPAPGRRTPLRILF